MIIEERKIKKVCAHVCVCVCVRVREREREGARDAKRNI